MTWLRWQDPIAAGLMLLSAYATWSQVLDHRTSLARRPVLIKAVASATWIVVNASLGLWLSAVVSVQYTAAFVALAVLRGVEESSG